ncbi:MAG: DUF4296 domain-containing protein [Flavobacteriaceae bacterium]|jgi:hypothetical protein|uniref:DUF4296 domain-containing protein n=1 Tax=uncultured Flavobacterium sp. TaxID=165435 RepID=UPI000FB8EF9B|nr:DUF4296 domain-containing protein [uncultured Flavobacterium sp.]RTL12217.1 MAG: DUF4296 domain-containing protein [Flavobacteriaceae bacterium]TXI67137.1 MAG: DUF4296 domain-containing protein [Flavobacterium sp.]
MKQLLFLFVTIFIVSCSKNPVPKPDNLLDEKTMVDILYDVSLLQAIEGSMPNKLMEHNIEMDQYIFKKYKIDSVTYRQNQMYYAGDARKFKKIYKKVLERLDKEKQTESNNKNQSSSSIAPDSTLE